MRLILGIGNPGAKYDGTRHNIGFTVVDWLAKQASADFREKSKFSALIAETSISDQKCILIKPQTYYNDIGISARAIMDFYKLTIDDLLVIHDDAVLDFGKIRIRQGGRDAGNNGLKSLHQHVGQDFWHIRIGTDNILRKKIGDTDFVLGKFNSDEQEIIKSWTLPQTTEITKDFLTDDIEPTSYRFGKEKDQ